MKNMMSRINQYMWGKETRDFFSHWMKLLFSLKGFWFFLPCVIGTLATYWFMHHGYSDTENTIKPAMESIAVQIIGTAAAICLVRFVIYRTKNDIILLLMAVNCFCREIHFRGTSLGVFIAALVILLLFIIWKNDIIDTIKNADAY